MHLYAVKKELKHQLTHYHYFAKMIVIVNKGGLADQFYHLVGILTVNMVFVLINV